VTVKEHPQRAGPAHSFTPPRDSPSVHLDALRGFAAFSVMLSHWRGACFVPYADLSFHNPVIAAAYFLTGLGHQWVIVFFVMSGYLVGGSVLRSVQTDRWSWRAYLLTRLTRLYIVLLPALILGGAIDYAGSHMPGTQSVYTDPAGEHALYKNGQFTLTASTLAANALFLQNITLPGMHGQHIPTYGSNGVLWSLSNEFWYYIAFPPLVFALAAIRSWRVRIAYGVFLLALGWFTGLWIVVMGIPWLMGVAIHYLPPAPARSKFTRALFIAAAVFLLIAGLALGFQWDSILSDLLLGIVVTFLVWVTLHCATAPVPKIYARIAQRSARSSYTLYLVHVPFLVFLKAYLRLPNSFAGWQKCAISIALLLLVVAWSQLIYQLFEANTDRIRKWIKPYVLRKQAA
jgi:peptidoglycan/LPS O-acetylase OafA/YrhL